MRLLGDAPRRQKLSDHESGALLNKRLRELILMAEKLLNSLTSSLFSRKQPPHETGVASATPACRHRLSSMPGPNSWALASKS